MKPAMLLASPIIRRRLTARKMARALKSFPSEALSPIDQAFLRLAREIFSRDEQGRTLVSAK